MNDQIPLNDKISDKDFPIIVREKDGMFVIFVPSLGIIARDATLEKCYNNMRKARSELLAEIDEADLTETLYKHQGHQKTKMWRYFAAGVLSFVILASISLLPATYLLSNIRHQIPMFTDIALDAVQKRIVNDMTERNKQILANFATGFCPIVDELVTARCEAPSNIPLHKLLKE